MFATKIQWDTDGDTEALASLPTEVEIPQNIADQDDDDAISDWLSDTFGYCHFGFGIEVRQNLGLQGKRGDDHA